MNNGERLGNGDRADLTSYDLDGVPPEVVHAFLAGLNDVRDGRTISVEQALTEGRRRIALHRADKNKKRAHDPAIPHRKPSIP